MLFWNATLTAAAGTFIPELRKSGRIGRSDSLMIKKVAGSNPSTGGVSIVSGLFSIQENL